MSLLSHAAPVWIIILVGSTLLTPAAEAASPYRTAQYRWQGEGFAAWQLNGVVARDGTLRLDPATARPGSDPYPAGGYHGRNYYNGGSFVVGEALGPETAAEFPFYEAIASWNADTPSGSWIDVELRARVGRRWSRWYSMGVWAADGGSVQRHSVDGQSGANVRVDVDTLKLSTRRTGASALQMRLKLFSDGAAVPSLRSAGVTVSTTPAMPGALESGNAALWNRVLDVPTCSQMVYPDGGEVWCSPTSTSMVLGYWRRDGSTCEPRVRHAVDGVFDWMYDGHGNWSFNTAYAGAQGFDATVTRFDRLADAEPWIAAGVPVIYSVSWGRGELDGAPAGSSNGHLSVLVGFDAAGNPVVNDSAAADNSSVRRTYKRAQFERLWLGHSGGTVYLVYPPGHAVPGL